MTITESEDFQDCDETVDEDIGRGLGVMSAVEKVCEARLSYECSGESV